MKEEAQQPWEAAVRRVVETHEFEYDPAAWAGMEQLLEEAALPYAKPTSSWWAQAWKWLIPTIVVLVVGTLWLTNQQPAPSLQGSLPIFAEPDGVEREKQEAEQESPILQARPRSRKVTSVPPLPTKPIRLLPEGQTKIPELLPYRQTPATLIPLDARPVGPIRYDEKLELNIPAIDIKRKRNRKTLFPDVIKNY
ncbi:MAG TPA: hypothetical protein VJ933_03105 [Phaeodactylibacter sp.]|nr:hypothetical protein [Phaeodactylibacter sp.]